MSRIITVDGPSGAGKGTLCQYLASETGFDLLDSGALYRLTALSAELKGTDFRDEQTLADIARGLDVTFSFYENAESQNAMVITLSGQDVTRTIRQEHVGLNASKVAAYDAVRQALLARQRDFANTGKGLIADGRDMGTTVFPDAPVKIFLTASAQARAERRVKQLIEAGQGAQYEKILADIIARDERDINRASSPLKPADDALLLDSTQLSITEVCAKAMAALQENAIV